MAGFEAIMCQASQANTPSIQTIATVLAANVNRGGFAIQNQGTNPLFVRLGSGATTSVFHIILKGGTAVNDGNGGVFSMLNGVCYQGIVTQAGTAPTYTVLEV